jgi:hypothetical protein
MKRNRGQHQSNINDEGGIASSQTPELSEKAAQPSKRRKMQFGQSPNLPCHQHTKVFEHFRRLDPAIPVEAKRIETRHKQILKGKNTAGYDLYQQKVPKHERKKIAEHPATPDYKTDIPNRRWLGLLKAWRVSLHQYDPKDFQSNTNLDGKGCDDPEISSDKKKITLQPKPLSVQDKQIEEASNKGLLVDFEASASSTSAMSSSSENHLGGVYKEERSEGNEDELDKWENNRKDIGDDELLLDYGDSDDELL